MHCAIVGNTALQPLSAGFAMHCVSVGSTGTLTNACCVTLPAMAPLTVIASPACRTMAPEVETSIPAPEALLIPPFTVIVSVELPVGVAVRVMAPPEAEVTAPETVNGPFVEVMEMLPVVVDTVRSAPSVVAPVLLMETEPPPDCVTCPIWSAPVLVIAMLPPPVFEAPIRPACVVSVMPLPALATRFDAITLPLTAPDAVRTAAAAPTVTGALMVRSPALAMRKVPLSPDWVPECPATVPTSRPVALVYEKVPAVEDPAMTLAVFASVSWTLSPAA